MEMEIPVIDFSQLDGEKRTETMALLHDACQNWGFFLIENHGIDEETMEQVKNFINKYYEENLKDKFYKKSEITKALDNKEVASNIDWESSFFIWHRPKSNLHEFPDFSDDFCKTMDTYIDQLVKVAERLSQLICENLGLNKDHIKNSFAGTAGPSVGTKVAKYPECPKPERIRGLREHTDAGGIILLLQDDQVPGLEFFKDGKWVQIPPTQKNAIFVNTGDQVEVISNGRYKSILHRVMAVEKGSRLSVATFYNPAPDAVISPASKVLYPSGYRFRDYLKLYGKTKFLEKASRFETMKKIDNGEHDW